MSRRVHDQVVEMLRTPLTHTGIAPEEGGVLFPLMLSTHKHLSLLGELLEGTTGNSLMAAKVRVMKEEFAKLLDPPDPRDPNIQ